MAAVVCRSVLAAGALLAVSACASVSADARTFEGSSWQVTAINGQPAPPGLEVRFEDGRIGGRLGCNSFGGSYRVERQLLIVGRVAMTRMACASAVDGPAVSPMTFERWAASVLASRMRITWQSGAELTLSNAAGSIALRRAR